MFSREAEPAADAMPPPAVLRRYALGLAWESELARVTAALVEFRGRVRRGKPRVLGCLARPLGEDLARQSRQIARGHPVSSAELADFGQAAAQEIAAAARELLCEHDSLRKEILLAGLCGPEWWRFRDHAPPSCLPLVEPAGLAEATGLSIIDDFAARDLVQCGQGGPLGVAPEWLLLADRKETAAGRTRVLLDLAGTVRLSYLPSGGFDEELPDLYGFDAAPGLDLLAEIWKRAGRGEDLSPAQLASRAAQGRRLPELLAEWLADPLLNDRPGWSPHGLPVDFFAEDAVAGMASQAWGEGVRIEDLLCTAVHLAAEATARALERHLPKRPVVDGLILSGPGAHCGLYVRALGERLPELHTRTLGDLNMSEEALPAATAAVLAMLFVDQAPAAQPTTTGAETPRLLGRLTPGSPSRWQRLLGEIAENRPATLPLRYAV